MEEKMGEKREDKPFVSKEDINVREQGLEAVEEGRDLRDEGGREVDAEELASLVGVLGDELHSVRDDGNRVARDVKVLGLLNVGPNLS